MKIKTIQKYIDLLFHGLSFLSFTCVSVLVMIQVIARYSPWFSAPWTDELTRMFFLYSVMFGAPMAIKHEEYAVIDIITGSLKNKHFILLKAFDMLLIILISFAGMTQARKFFRAGLRTLTTSLQINMGFFYIAPLMIFILTLVFSILKFVEIIRLDVKEKAK
jgi:TRAP-type C4-dicarboxylate transport system permease small subunit